MTLLAFLTTALLSALCTLTLLYRLAVRTGWHLVALAVGYSVGFVVMLAAVRLMG